MSTAIHSKRFIPANMDQYFQWLTQNAETVKKKAGWLKERQPISLSPKVIHSDLLHLTSKEIALGIERFPANAHTRSTFGQVRGMPPAWYSHQSKLDIKLICFDQGSASKQTAVACGATETKSTSGERHVQDILLFAIPHVSEEIAKYVQLHALVREYARTLITPLWHNYGHEYILNVEQRYHSEGHSFLAQFAHISQKYSPMSFETEPYWPLPGVSNELFYACVSEELSEAVAAYLLGYNWCSDKKRWWDPFVDRPLVRSIVEDFILATVAPALKYA
ncbi:MAG: hypothetical protein M3Q80_01420 [bacterium]|nr:hypothetical protein [bacterium]